MSGVSPTIEGFRAAFRRPSLTFAEIAWRWTVGAVAWALFLFWCIEYLDTLPVTDADAALLWTRQPLLVGRAIAHILRGSLNRAGLAALLAALALSLLWIIAASVGRSATVRSLLDYFRRGVATNVSTETHPSAEPRLLPSLIGINFLRVALMIAGLLAFAGAALLVRLALPRAHPHPGLAFMLFLPLGGLICIVWPMLNWLLSLACIFAVRDGDDVLSATVRRGHLVQGTLGTGIRRKCLDRAGAPHCLQRCHDCRFVSDRFRPGCSDAIHNRLRHSRHARVFRRRGLVVYGAPWWICLHRRNAGDSG